MTRDLEPGEVLVAAVAGQARGLPAVVALTDRRVRIAVDAGWDASVQAMPLTGITVEGWQDQRHANLLLRHEATVVTVDRIGDKNLAIALAHHIRAAAT